MSDLITIILYTTLGGALALVGGSILLTRKKLSHTITHALAAFAAGSLLGASFLDLLPEAFHHLEELGIEEGETTIFMAVLLGIVFFFLLERVIHWLQHPHREHKDTDPKPIVPLVVFGDSVHNFIDGVVIAATFLADPTLGIITTFAIVAHELPQEIGDFGILLHEGVKRSKVFLYNALSQAAAIVGAVITYFVGTSVEGILPFLIAVTSGFFIYIALSNLVPQIHEENKKGFAILETSALIIGILVIWGSLSFLGHGH